MYASRDDISAIYGPETLSDITPADMPDPPGAVDQALADASAEIDGYLSARYALPLGRAPKVLRRPCIDIAIYILAHSHTRLTSTIETRYAQATALLGRIGKGDVGLGVDEPASIVQGSKTGTASGADFIARPRRFGRNRS